MRRLIAFALAALLGVVPAFAQVSPVSFAPQPVLSVAGNVSATTGDTPCVLFKYKGTTAGKPTVEVAAGGDVTFKIAGSADTTTGSPSLNGVFDLSTPAAAVDTMGEFVNLVNTTGSNWVGVLVSCLASDLTDNTLDTLAATEALNPKGAALFRDVAVASATSTFSAQVAALQAGKETDISFFLTGNKPNTNPFAGVQTYVQNVRERITSTGTIGLFAVLGVTRTYDSNGKVAETVRTLWSETGAATTVEKAKDFNSGPIVSAPGELLIVRQRSGTDLTAAQMQIVGFGVKRTSATP